MSMNVWRLMIIRLTGSPTARSGRPSASVAVISTRSTHPCSSSRAHRPLAGGEADRLAVAAQEAVGDRVVAGRPGVRHGEERVLGRRRAGDVGGLAGPVLGAGSPRAVAHGQAVDLDALAVDRDVAGDATELVEVVGRAERRADGGQRLGRHDAVEAEAQLEPLAVVVAEVVGLRRLDDADRDAGGQHDVAQVGVGRQLQRRVVGAVEDVPRQPGRVVPHPGAAGHGADVRADHRVEPAAEPPLGGVEREPRRLRLPPAVAQLRRVQPVVVRAEGRGRVPSRHQYPSARAAVSSTTGIDQAVRARRRSGLRPLAYRPVALIQNAAERMA